MNLKKITYFFIGIFLFTGISDMKSQDAQTLLSNMDQIMFSPKDKQGVVQIILINKD